MPQVTEEAERALSLPQFMAHSSGGLLAFPHGEPAILAQRLSWLQAEDVTAVYNYGSKSIAGFNVLGVGYAGLVLLVQQYGRLLALKLRRTDGPQDSFHREAEAIATANPLNIGPQLISYSDDCLLMDYLPGPNLIDWLHSPAATLGETWSIIHLLLDQAFHLDQAGLDHGDLRCVTEHVRIETIGQGHRPVIIDFGKASRDRRPANVTTLTQGLFLSTTVARTISERFSGTALDCQTAPRRSQLIELLRHYKRNSCQDAHKTLLNFLKP